MKTEQLLEYVGQKVTLEENRDWGFCEHVDYELEHITKNSFRVGIFCFKSDEITSYRFTPSFKVLRILKDETCAVTKDRPSQGD